jgi:hypothetical protein
MILASNFLHLERVQLPVEIPNAFTACGKRKNGRSETALPAELNDTE